MNINVYKVTFLLYQLLIFLNVFIVYIFRQRDCKKKGFYPQVACDFFISPSWWIGNEQLFQVGPTLRWFLHFIIFFRVGWSILFDNGSAFCDSGKFRLITIMEKKSLKVYATFCSWDTSSSSSVRVILYVFNARH